MKLMCPKCHEISEQDPLAGSILGHVECQCTGSSCGVSNSGRLSDQVARSDDWRNNLGFPYALRSRPERLGGSLTDRGGARGGRWEIEKAEEVSLALQLFRAVTAASAGKHRGATM
jgi:hypothetical protein